MVRFGFNLSRSAYFRQFFAEIEVGGSVAVQPEKATESPTDGDTFTLSLIAFVLDGSGNFPTEIRDKGRRWPAT